MRILRCRWQDRAEKAEAERDTARAALHALAAKWRDEAATEQRVSFCADELDAVLALCVDAKDALD